MHQESPHPVSPRFRFRAVVTDESYMAVRAACGDEDPHTAMLRDKTALVEAMPTPFGDTLKDFWFINRVWVPEHLRRQGYGFAVVSELQRIIQKRNLPGLIVTPGGYNTPREVLHGFYSKLSFRPYSLPLFELDSSTGASPYCTWVWRAPDAQRTDGDGGHGQRA